MSINYKMSANEQFVNSGNASIWTCTTGVGIPFLMFNGGPGCDDYLAPVARLIEDVCQIVRFEPRGCGRSVWDGNYSVETLIDDAEAVRQSYGLRECIVGGHSFGTDLAIAYALRFPRNAIGLIGIAGGRIVNDRTWHATYKRNLNRVGEDLGDADFHADSTVNLECIRSWRDYIQRPRLLSEISSLKIPATFIYGTEDIRPDWPTRQLAALLPHGEFIEIDGAAHSIWLSHTSELRARLCDAIGRIRRLYGASSSQHRQSV